MIYDDDLTDDQIYRPSDGGSSDTSSTQTTTQTPTIKSPTIQPATLDPSGSLLGFVFPVNGTNEQTSSTTAADSPAVGAIGTTPALHGPGETWTMGPGQGCAAGYAEQMTADGRWTCIPMSDFQKIFKGDFSPLFAGNAPAGVAPVATDSLVWSGGKLQGTALEVATADGYVAPSASGSTSLPAGSSGASSGTTSISEGGSAVNRLIDVMSAMYAGAGVKGGGTGFGGIISGPIADTPTGGMASAASTGPSKGLVIGILIVGGLAFWYYNKHKKAAHHA